MFQSFGSAGEEGVVDILKQVTFLVVVDIAKEARLVRTLF
jgi:hypothetical protein